MRTIYAGGTSYECGVVIGKECRLDIRKLLELAKKDAQHVNKDWEFIKSRTERYFANIPDVCKPVVELIEGVAKGAEMDGIEIKAILVEELYTAQPDKCSVVIANDVIGHNNDLSDDYRETIAHVCMDIDGFGRIHSVGPAGFCSSIGLNSYGVVLTGNELSANDEKIGVPRSIVAIAILFAKNFEQALDIALLPQRASSYNNVIVCGSQAASVEGSGTDYAILMPDDGVLVHSNHYISPKMLKYEASVEEDSGIVNSIKRYESAKKQAHGLVESKNEVGVADVKNILSSHENGFTNNSICRHGEHFSTVFSFVYKVGNPYFELASGNPCQNEYRRINI